LQLIDQFNAMLEEVSATPQFSHVHYLDLRNTLRHDRSYKKYWANELHPTEEGFGHQKVRRPDNETLRAHPGSLDSWRGICSKSPEHDADHGEVDECSNRRAWRSKSRARRRLRLIHANVVSTRMCRLRPMICRGEERRAVLKLAERRSAIEWIKKAPQHAKKAQVNADVRATSTPAASNEKFDRAMQRQLVRRLKSTKRSHIAAHRRHDPRSNGRAL
jgi:hypothetical protein